MNKVEEGLYDFILEQQTALAQYSWNKELNTFCPDMALALKKVYDAYSDIRHALDDKKDEKVLL